MSSESSSDSFSAGWARALAHARNPDVDGWLRRELPGELRLVAAHHPSHAQLKRASTVPAAAAAAGVAAGAAGGAAGGAADAAAPAPAVVLDVPFNDAGFSFLRVPPRELVALLHARSAGDAGEGGAGDAAVDAAEFDARVAADALAEPAADAAAGGGGAAPPSLAAAVPAGAHAVLINASPFGVGHSLLVPSPAARRPQAACASSLALAARACRALARGAPPGWAPRADVRVGFNSLAAYASVNHRHFHVFHVGALFGAGAGGALPIERSARSRVAARAGVALDALRAWPLPALVVSCAAGPGAGRSPGAAVRAVVFGVLAPVLAHLRARRTPHHFLFAWEEGGEGGGGAAELRATVVPRAPQGPARGALGGAFTVALLEACGLAALNGAVADGRPAGDALGGVVEGDVVDGLRGFALPPAEFDALEAVAAAAVGALEA